MKHYAVEVREVRTYSVLVEAEDEAGAIHTAIAQVENDATMLAESIGIDMEDCSASAENGAVWLKLREDDEAALEAMIQKDKEA